MGEFSALRLRAGLSIPQVAEIFGFSQSTIYRWERGQAKPKKVVLDSLAERARGRASVVKEGFRFIDLFAGIGALRLGFESAGGNCVFTSEWDKFCHESYRKNFDTEHEIAGDIVPVEPSEIPEFDVLLAGFPCQPFSIAGVSKKNSLGRPHGFEDETQGNLFFKIHQILQHHRPQAFLLENVRNLLSHDQGVTFEVIHRLLTGNTPPPGRQRRLGGDENDERIAELVREYGPLGYHVSFRVIDARAWVPQHRERVFIVGFRDDVEFDLSTIPVPEPSAGPRLHTILHETQRDPCDGRFVVDTGRVNERYTLSEELWEYLQEYAAWHRQRGNGFGFGLVGPDDVARTLSARYFKDGSEILVRRDGKEIPRRLTPRECARLMGFRKPDGSEWEIPVSDTQAYKQFGNAAVVPVIEHIAGHMVPYLASASRNDRGWQEALPLELTAAAGG